MNGFLCIWKTPSNGKFPHQETCIDGYNCHGDCGTMKCTCKKHRITCSIVCDIVCDNCKGSGCMNSTPNEDDSIDDVDTDELS